MEARSEFQDIGRFAVLKPGKQSATDSELNEQRCPRFREDTVLFEAGSGLVVFEHYMYY